MCVIQLLKNMMRFCEMCASVLMILMNYVQPYKKQNSILWNTTFQTFYGTCSEKKNIITGYLSFNMFLVTAVQQRHSLWQKSNQMTYRLSIAFTLFRVSSLKYTSASTCLYRHLWPSLLLCIVSAIQCCSSDTTVIRRKCVCIQHPHKTIKT